MAAIKNLQMVGFQIGVETFAVPIALVREIVRVPDITTIPQALEWVEGVINLRGKLVPIVDLRKRFREEHVSANKKNRILVAEIEGHLVGFVVDAASEVLTIPPSDIEAPPAVFSEGELNYLQGMGKLGHRLILLIDFSKVLQRGELKRLGELQARGAAMTEA